MAKKNPGQEWGASLSAATHDFKKAAVIVGRIENVVYVEGGRYDNKRTRVTLTDDDGTACSVYLPESWGARVAPFVGAKLRVERIGAGLASRYDVKPEAGAKKAATVPAIPVEIMEEREPKGGTRRPKGKRAKK